MSRVSPSSQSTTLETPDQLFPLIRHLSTRLTPLLARTPLTPNQITALSLLIGFGGAALFALGDWAADIAGGLLLTLSYTLDNCDGEIARLKNMSSEWGAQFDDLADWLVDSAFFAMLGVGVWSSTGGIIWLWLGIATTLGATIDYVINLFLFARERKDPVQKTREEAAVDIRQPQDFLDWVIYIFHKLSRTDFCIIVLVLALFDVTWILLPLGAVGAQVFWFTDMFQRARGWHT